MIDFSGRATRAGTRGIAVAAAVSCFTVTPLGYHEPAHADGHVGSAAARQHERRPARPEPDRDPVARHHGQNRADDHKAVPRTRIILDPRAPRGPVTPGETYQWPYSVTNTGSTPARDVALTTRPNRHLKVAATPPKCRWARHNRLVCRIGLIPGGATKKGAITARVAKDAPAGQKLSSPARISWNGRPPSDARVTSFPPVTVASPPATDLAVTSSQLPEKVGPGGEIPYEVSVTNRGPVTAEGVVVRSAVADEPLGSPCAVLLAPAENIAGKAAAIKPALPPCGTTQDESTGHVAAPPCGAPARPGNRPVILPCQEGQAEHGRADGPAQVPAAPCGAVVQRSAASPPCAAQQARPVVPPCAAARDKPLARENADRPVTGSCAAPPVAVPGKAARIIPERAPAHSVPGKAAPARDLPILIGRSHRCVLQGAGFVCPIGSIPPGRTRTLKLAVRARPHTRPHRLRCLSSVASRTPDRDPANNSVDCHTRVARPLIPQQNLAVHRLPETGFPYGLLGICGAGLAGVGFVLFRMGRVRRGPEGQDPLH